MSALHVELARRMRVMVPDLEREWRAALDAWTRQSSDPLDRLVFFDSACLHIHGFFTGVERLLELIARRLDRTVPTGEVWHQELLYRMRTPVPDRRPAVLTDESALILDKLRRFRHVVRNVYPMELEESRAAEVFALMPQLWPQLRSEILRFAEFLEAIR